MTDLRRLRTKLCRELAQSEHDARTHPRREARRLPGTPPAVALDAIAVHADAMWPRYVSLMTREQTLGLGVGRAVGAVFSALRHLLLDRIIDAERSYRGTLLGLRHGIDTARLLREVATREGDARLTQFCEELLTDRVRLIADAEQALAWFADRPGIALKSGLRLAIEGPRKALHAE